MPEGDSVFLVARKLDTALRGELLAAGELHIPKHATAELAGRQVLSNDTHGKHLLTRFSAGVDDDGLTLHSHLRMDGTWTVVRAGLRLPRHLEPDIRILLRVAEGPTAYGLTIPVVELLPTADERQPSGTSGPTRCAPTGTRSRRCGGCRRIRRSRWPRRCWTSG